MNGGPRIIPIDAGQPETGGTEPVLDLREKVEAEAAPDTEEAPAAAPAGGNVRARIVPALALIVILAWTGLFGWVNQAVMRTGADPAQWSQWLIAWSQPVLLVLVTLLLLRRTSRREAARFADVAQSLAFESDRLEARLATTNTELSLARDFIAAQSRDLESLGRIAVDRLSATAGQLQNLIVNNGAQVDRIGQVSDHALENMEKLRGQLPVVANAAKDVTNTIATAGRTAHAQLEDMIAGFQRLNEFGQASERQVTAIRERVDAALAAFGDASAQMSAAASERYEAIERETAAHRERFGAEETAALAALRTRSDALAQELAQQRGVVATAEEDALAALNARFTALREETAALGRAMVEAEEAALGAFGNRSSMQIGALRQAIEEIGRDHDGLLADSRQRLAAFEESSQSMTQRLHGDAAALDREIARRRSSFEAAMAAQRDALFHRLTELDGAIGERSAAMAEAGAAAADALTKKLADFDHAIEAQRLRQLEDARLLCNHCDAIGDRVAAFSATLRASGEQGAETAAAVDQAMGVLNQRLFGMREALTGTDSQISELTTSAVRLLELIQAGGDHTRTQIPEALRSTEAGLAKIEDRVVALRDTLREAGDSGRALSDHVGTTRTDLTEAVGEITRLHEAFSGRASEQEARLTALRDVLGAARKESDALSQDVDGRLSGAIARLTEAAGKAGSELRDSTAREIESLAEHLGEESNAAIMRVLQGRGAELIARLEEAIDNAAAASRDAAIQMRDQLTKVDELAGNLESRVARARDRAEEQVDNDFARRTAIITESLNSTAIDITKALSSDVSETAWASYLRGDRGIFTRRAVSLLDSAEVKGVQQHYEADAEFREHVNRYIHDFESMLRQLLSTRDGNALGVTLLSSDMGKLYVALAQGIERLRT